jgi:putative nucleotidyltransferase with HDIG domain
MAEHKELPPAAVKSGVMFETNVERQGWALHAYAEAASALVRADSSKELIEGVCAGIVRQWPYVLAWVGIAEHDDRRTVRVEGAHGSAAQYTDGIDVTWSRDTTAGRGPTGTCIETGMPQIISDTELVPEFKPWLERARRYGIRSSVAVPIFGVMDQVKGALTVYATVPDVFGDQEVQLFANLAKEISYGLGSIEQKIFLKQEIEQKIKAQEQLADSLRATIEAMSKTMEWRDPYTAGHQNRVARIAVLIAKELGWAEEKIRGLYMAALVHDIGKVAIPSEILTKPTKLTDLEMQLVRQHPETGYQILKDIPFSWPIAKIVLQHHECLNGSGYPNGIKGDEILDEAKLIAVADTIEAMASHRPYRAALGLDAAMCQLRMGLGTRFEACYVEAANALAERGELQKMLSAN